MKKYIIPTSKFISENDSDFICMVLILYLKVVTNSLRSMILRNLKKMRPNIKIKN